MLIPIRFECQNCKKTKPVKVHLDATSLDWKCEYCGHQNMGFLDATTGSLFLARSNYEFLVEKDYSMAIVMAATAFECELSRLYRKWTGINAGLKNEDLDDGAIDTMLRKHQRITDRVEEVCRLLDSRGLDEFSRSHSLIHEAVTERFPSLRVGSLAADFQQTLFWPRNRILHSGYAKYNEKDAARCYAIAAFGLYVLNEMDKARGEKLNTNLV